jgi:hypothetical protein
MPTPTPSRRKRRRALELLETSLDGCTEAIMLAYTPLPQATKAGAQTGSYPVG